VVSPTPNFLGSAQSIADSNVWFSPTFKNWYSWLDDLPFDHHFITALIAPRGLLAIDDSPYDWLFPRSTWGFQTAGRKVYEALGVADSMSISVIGIQTHCSFPSSQLPELQAFVDRFLKGLPVDTAGMVKNDGNG